MLKKLREFAESLKAARVKARDEALSKLDDPFAREIDWSSLNCGGANFRTRVISQTPDGISFLPTWGGKIFAGLFIVIGAVIMWVGTGLKIDPLQFLRYPLSMLRHCIHVIPHTMRGEKIFLFLFGSVFFLAGLVTLYFFIKPVIFDRTWKKFFKGFAFFPQKQVDFEDIYAVQIVTSISSKYVNYQINLVLTDKRRVNVVSHINKETALADADTIGKLLGKPVWNLS